MIKQITPLFMEGPRQAVKLTASVDDNVDQESLVCMEDACVSGLDLACLGFDRAVAAATGRPGDHPRRHAQAFYLDCLIRRSTVEHPFGTIKQMSGGGRFLTRGLKAAKTEAVLSILAFNVLRAANRFGNSAIITN